MTAKVTFDNWDSIIPRVQGTVSLIVRKVAFDIQTGAQNRVPVDTGAAKASIHVITGTDDYYSAAIANSQAAFQAKNPGETLEFWPDAPLVSDPNKITALVTVAVLYAWILEKGNQSGTRLPRPFLQPAAEEAAPGYFAAIEQAVSEGTEKAGA